MTEAALLCVNNRVLMFTGENAGLAISAWRSRMLPTLHTTQWSSKILTNIYGSCFFTEKLLSQLIVNTFLALWYFGSDAEVCRTDLHL